MLFQGELQESLNTHSPPLPSEPCTCIRWLCQQAAGASEALDDLKTHLVSFVSGQN